MNSSPEHYFSAEPATPEQRRTLTVRLAGRELQVVTAGGIFSPDHVDHATAFLVEHCPVPEGLVARAAETDGAEGGAPVALLDIGCGWGPIALALALQAPGAAVWAVEVNQRAAELARENAHAADLLAASPGAPGITVATPDEVPAEVTFDGIWSNPPIRVGKEALHGILRQWIPRLAPGASARLVVGKQLGAPSLLTWLNREFSEKPSPHKLKSGGFTAERVGRHKQSWVLEVTWQD